MAIQAEFGDFIDQLDLFQKYELPWMASQTLRKLFWVSRKGMSGGPVWEQMQGELDDTFDNVSSWTKRSFFSTSQRVRKDHLRLLFGHKDDDFGFKGNAAADYLTPHGFGGPAFATRAIRRLAREGVTHNYWVPDTDGPRNKRRGRAWGNQLVRGLWAASAFSELQPNWTRGIKNDSFKAVMDKRTTPDGKVLYVPYAGGDKTKMVFRRKARAGGQVYNDKPLPPGVYERLGGKHARNHYYKRFIQELKEWPTFSKKYDFSFAVETSMNREIDGAFASVFSKTMARWEPAQKMTYG